MRVTPIIYSAEQRVVITTTTPRVYVHAHAGSGKTVTLCARVRHLLDQGVLQDEILILSFSNNACKAVRKYLPQGHHIKTFHAFSHGLVADDVQSRGRSSPELVKPAQMVALLSTAIRECPDDCASVKAAGINLKTVDAVNRLAKFVTRIQNSDTLAQRLVGSRMSGFVDYAPVLPALFAIIRSYNRLLNETGLIDYPFMLKRARHLLVTEKLPFKHVLVDECQDMNAAQAGLLELITRQVPNIMVFGDPNQAIYGFMGAQARSMAALLGGAVTLRLTQSFRLTHQNAALANALLGETRHPVLGVRPGSMPTLAHCLSASQQEARVVEMVQRWKENRVHGDQIAILARSKMQLRCVEQALRTTGHETNGSYQNRMPDDLDRLLTLLEFVEHSKANVTAGKKGNAPWLEQRLRDIPDDTTRARAEADCLRMLKTAIGVRSFEGRYIAARKIYLRLIRAADKDASPLMIEFGRWEAISRKFKTVPAFRAHIAKLRRQSPVIMSTIHSAKGDEWDHVIVLGVTEGSIPLFMAEKQAELDEEKRLLYVAMTRAKKTLTLMHAPYHHALSRQTFEGLSSLLSEPVMAQLGPSRRL